MTRLLYEGGKTMAEYTPGPWEVGPVGKTVHVYAGDDTICEPPMTWSDATCSWEPSDSMDRWEANARLIAAAPDYHAGFEIVRDRFIEVCNRGGTMQDFLDAGALRELADAHARATQRHA
jgi:hypothetical protein